MRDLILTIVVFSGLVYALRKPHIGLLIWSWLGYMNPHRLSWGFAQTMPFVQISALVTMFSLLVSKEKKNFPVTPVTVSLILFLLVMILSTIFAVYPDRAFDHLIKVFKTLALIFLTFLIINDKEKLNQLVTVITFSIAFFGIKGGIFTILTGGAYRVWGPPNSLIGDNNEIGLAVLISIPLMVYLRKYASNIWYKRFILGSIGLCAITVLSTYSRGAFLAFVCMSFFLWLKMPNKLLTAIIGIVFALIAFAFMPAEYTERLNTIETYEQDASAMGRINAWTVAINIANDRVFGGGFDHWSGFTFAQYAPVPEDVHDAHSIYFEVLGELGYMGLLLYLLIFFFTWRSATWLISHSKKHQNYAWYGDLARMIQVSLVAFASGGAFLGLAYWDFPYHLASVVVIMRYQLGQQLADKKPEEAVIVDNSNLAKKKWIWQ